MKTLILPGYSIKNKDWAEETQKQLEEVSEVSVVNWPHWETGQTEENWIENEAVKIIGEIGGIGEIRVNILAKSIGTLIAMLVLKKNPKVINRLILCGIPINDFLPGNEKYYEMLRNFFAANVLCIQNREDNHGTYDQAEKFVHAINPAIKVISKEREDHEYPYPEEFIKYFTIPEVSLSAGRQVPSQPRGLVYIEVKKQ